MKIKIQAQEIWNKMFEILGHLSYPLALLMHFLFISLQCLSGHLPLSRQYSLLSGEDDTEFLISQDTDSQFTNADLDRF